MLIVKVYIVLFNNYRSHLITTAKRNCQTLSSGLEIHCTTLYKPNSSLDFSDIEVT